MNNSDKENVLNKSVINCYPGHMAKAKRQIKEQLDFIDIVYELIDARIPYSSKIREIQGLLKNKKVLLIMTKMDLCDIVVTEKWKKYYEEQGYSVIGVDLKNQANLNAVFKKTEEMMQDLYEKWQQKGLKKRKTRILCIGIPNVGKSTFINRFVGKRKTHVGNKPGVTKQLEWIRVNEQFELLDSPGILWPKLDQEYVAIHLACMNAIREEILPLEDVVWYFLNFLGTYYPNILKERYGIENTSEVEEMLEQIGKKRGCLKKGGIIDMEKVIQIVMNDLKSDTISGITLDRIEQIESK